MGVIAGMVAGLALAGPRTSRRPAALLPCCLDFEELVMGPSEAGVRFLGWMAQGACQRADPGLFFPFAAGSAGLSQISAAKAICQGCAVRDPCLSYGLATRQDGIWGGTTLEERRTIRQPADLPRHASPDPRHVPSLT
jgi:WhiB family redox-sensing transcriptional regulator